MSRRTPLAVLGAVSLLAGCDLVLGLERPPPPQGAWASVAAGDAHACAIGLDGSLWCWGDNAAGQLGGEGSLATTPRRVGEGTWRAVAAGAAHTCAISTDGSLWCWGSNTVGQLGIGDTMSRATPVQVGAGPYAQLALGAGHTCALDEAGALTCWGANVQGQVGDGTRTQRLAPVPIAGEGWRSVSARGLATCAISADDGLWCWGYAAYGQLADPNLDLTLTVPAPHRAPGAWTAVALGDVSTCALSTEGRVRCWGYNTDGQLGDGTTTVSALGVDVGRGATDWRSIVAGGRHACGLRADGTLSCWGDNARGQVPNADAGDTVSLPQPVLADFGEAGVVALGGAHTCVVDRDHHLRCAGSDSVGQLGRGGRDPRAPAQVPGTWHAVTAGRAFTCALDAAGEAYCWGIAEYGALGEGTRRARQVPTRILADGPWDDLVAGTDHVCARRGDEAWCWGYNGGAQFGDGSVASAPLPRPVAGAPWATARSSHACAVAAGRVMCWGPNQFAQTGQVASPGTLAPTPIDADATWTRVAAGAGFSCGVRAAGLACWGINTYGQIGAPVGPPTPTPTPVTLPVPGAVEQLALGVGAACAIVGGGAAACWGANTAGEVGDGTLGGATPPGVLPGAWAEIVVAASHACGVRADGALACWGGNTAGQLGDGTSTSQLAPTQVGDATDWAHVTASWSHTCATRTDGSLWCWGANGAGELGDGSSWSGELVEIVVENEDPEADS